MTSGSFFLKGIRENMRRNLPFLALFTLGFLLVLPVFGLIGMENAKSVYTQDSFQIFGETMNYLQKEFLDCVTGGNGGLLLLIPGCAVLLGMAQLWYLHAGEKVDFSHSLPIKRHELLLIRTVSSLLIIAIPYALCLLLAYGAGALYGAVTLASVQAGVLAALVHLVYFAVFYQVTALAMLLTGNLFTAALGVGGLLVYLPLVGIVYDQMNMHFFYTYPSDMRQGVSLLAEKSPLISYLRTTEHLSASGQLGRGVLYGILLALLLLAVNLLVYKLRPSESFQSSIAFPKLQPVIKVAVGLPLILIICIGFAGYMSQSRFLWFAVCAVVLLLIFSAAMEFLYTLDLKKSFRPKVSTGVLAVLLGVVIFGYRMDLFGIDSYLPEKEKVESMSVFLYSIDGKLQNDNAVNFRGNLSEILKKERVENFDGIYEAAREGVAYASSLTGEQRMDHAYTGAVTSAIMRNENGWYEEGDTMVSISVGYHLKSGRDVYRTYLVPESKTLVSSIGEIYDNWEYRQRILPTSYIDVERIDSISLQNFSQQMEPVKGNQDTLENLYRTYKGELEAMTFKESSKERIVARILVSTKDKDAYGGQAEFILPIYEGFTKTIELLEKGGSSVFVSPEEVHTVTLGGTGYGDTADTYGSYTTSDPEEIRLILDNISYNELKYSVGSKLLYDTDASLSFNNSSSTPFYPIMEGEEIEGILQKLEPEE